MMIRSILFILFTLIGLAAMMVSELFGSIADACERIVKDIEGI